MADDFKLLPENFITPEPDKEKVELGKRILLGVENQAATQYRFGKTILKSSHLGEVMTEDADAIRSKKSSPHDSFHEGAEFTRIKSDSDEGKAVLERTGLKGETNLAIYKTLKTDDFHKNVAYIVADHADRSIPGQQAIAVLTQESYAPSYKKDEILSMKRDGDVKQLSVFTDKGHPTTYSTYTSNKDGSVTTTYQAGEDGKVETKNYTPRDLEKKANEWKPAASTLKPEEGLVQADDSRLIRKMAELATGEFGVPIAGAENEVTNASNLPRIVNNKETMQLA